MTRYLILILILATVSCSEQTEIQSVEEVLSSPYFPLNQGHTVEYVIEEIVFRNSGTLIDSNTYMIRETVNSRYFDDAQEEWAVLDRYEREDISEEWQYDQSWLAGIKNNLAIRVEDNIKFVKLSLPLNEGLEWDGNAYFDDSAHRFIGGESIDYYKNWGSAVISMTGKVEINGHVFSDVLSVQMANFENRLEQRIGIEHYAKGVGLIYKELRILDTQCFEGCDDMEWEEKAEKGHIYIQKIEI